MAKQIQPGNLSERVILQQEIQVPDGGGGYTTQWITVTPLWAEVKLVAASRASEVVHADQAQPRDRYQITIRNRKGVTTDHRLVWLGLALNILDAGYPGPRSAFRVLEAEYGGPT